MYRYLTSLVKFIPRHWILLLYICVWECLLSSAFCNLLLAYGKVYNLMLVLQPATLLTYCYLELEDFLWQPLCIITPFAKSDDFISSILIQIFFTYILTSELWLGCPKLCWITVVKVDILPMFLIKRKSFHFSPFCMKLSNCLSFNTGTRIFSLCWVNHVSPFHEGQFIEISLVLFDGNNSPFCFIIFIDWLTDNCAIDSVSQACDSDPSQTSLLIQTII